MKTRYSLLVLLTIFLSVYSETHAASLTSFYHTASVPTINENGVNHTFKSGNYLYVSTEDRGGGGGLSVVNTQGTESQADDVLVTTYTSTSDISLPSSNVFESFLSGNALYVSTDEGLIVINTQGTPEQTDDAEIARYTSFSDPIFLSHAGGVTKTILAGNLLYVVGGGIVEIIDTKGTATMADDEITDLSLNSSALTMTLDGTVLYIGEADGIEVIDTQGTMVTSDDVLTGQYNVTTSPALSGGVVNHILLSGNYIYASVDGSGIVVINTQGTLLTADDTIDATFSTASVPALNNNSVKYFDLVGDILYVGQPFFGILAIDTKGTVTQSDDILLDTYDNVALFGDTLGAFSDADVYHSFVFGDYLYVSLQGNKAGLLVVKMTHKSSDTITVSLPVNATISITSPADVTMGAITGTGQSALTTNQAEWITKTNNSAGYELSIQASNASMQNANLDTVGAYTPATPSTPEPWSIAATDSEWGMHYSFPQSTLGNDTVWGADDTYADNWVNVPTTPYVIETATAPTDNIGDSAVILFGAEVGSDKIQPTGTYSVDVTMTATTL